MKWTLLAVGVALILGVGGYLYARHRHGQYHLDAAEAALKRRDFAAAGTHLDRCLGVWPGEPRALFLKAQALRRAGDFERARKHLRACDKKGVPGVLLDMERRLLSMQQGGLAEAARLLTFCVNNPDAPETPLVREATIQGCLTALVAGAAPAVDPDERARTLTAVWGAVDAWLKRATAPADEAIGLVWRGRLRLAAGDHAGALADLRRALELDPDHFEARLYLAEATVEEAPREAADSLQQLHRRDPGSRRVRFMLATLRHGLGELEEARTLLDGLLADNPDDVFAQIERAFLAVHLNDTADAAARAKRAVALAPNLPRAHWVLSRCLQAAGKPDEAKEAYDRFKSLEPRFKVPSP